MWQFMASRAKGYGLERDWWIDERQDPEKATRAAERAKRPKPGTAEWLRARTVVDPETGCHLWQGYVSGKGHATATITADAMPSGPPLNAEPITPASHPPSSLPANPEPLRKKGSS